MDPQAVIAVQEGKKYKLMQQIQGLGSPRVEDLELP